MIIVLIVLGVIGYLYFNKDIKMSPPPTILPNCLDSHALSSCGFNEGKCIYWDSSINQEVGIWPGEMCTISQYRHDVQCNPWPWCADVFTPVEWACCVPKLTENISDTPNNKDNFCGGVSYDKLTQKCCSENPSLVCGKEEYCFEGSENPVTGMPFCGECPDIDPSFGSSICAQKKGGDEKDWTCVVGQCSQLSATRTTGAGNNCEWEGQECGGVCIETTNSPDPFKKYIVRPCSAFSGLCGCWSWSLRG